MTSPYHGLDPRQFWKSGVAEHHPTALPDLYRKKFDIGPDIKIATAGSCFAQHIKQQLTNRGFAVLDSEKPPVTARKTIAQKYGYRLFSGRYGNIYTTRHLLQITQEAFGLFQPANAIWEREGRFFDAMRPTVEPGGLETAELVLKHRARHLARFQKLLKTTELFIFTFGLTEAWIDRKTGTTYPTAPETVAGTFDPDVFVFKNFKYEEIYRDFLRFKALVEKINPSIKFLLTVSPVPLTATARDDHVLVATTYSKSILRAVAGRLADEYDTIDYFPSYEIITAPTSKGFYFEPNMRSVSDAGVEAVMKVFFAQHAPGNTAFEVTDPNHEGDSRRAGPASDDDIVCEELLLDSFTP